MLTLYYPPFRADDDVELLQLSTVGIRAYIDDLAEFDAETLANGWREARRAHKVERWPTISDIRDRCVFHAGRRDGVKPLQPAAMRRMGRAGDEVPDKFPHRQMADEWMATERGQWALRNECGPECWDYVAERGEIPDREKVADLRDVATGRRMRLSDVTDEGQPGNWKRVMRDREASMVKRFLRQSAA